MRRQADRVRRALGGRRAERVVFGLERLARFGPELSGRLVGGVESRGKALLVHFEGGQTVYCHSLLYGRWHVVPRGRPPRIRRQLRFGVEGETQSALLYSASEIEVLEAQELVEHPFLRRLGPDPLDPKVGLATLEARIEARPLHGRRLGALLLDQSFVAGIGNYLRSEILFWAGIAPEHRLKDLPAARRVRLAEAILDVMRRAYHSGGITVEETLAQRLKSTGAPRRSYRHYVFGRAGACCRRCETPIIRAEAAGRRIYVCPGCQI